MAYTKKIYGSLVVQEDLTVGGSFTFPTTVTSLTVSGATALNGTVALGNATADTITQTGHLTTGGNCNCDWSGSSGTFKTSTGTNTLGGDVVIAGDVSIDAGKDLDLSGGAGTFTSGTGAVSLLGDVTIAANKTLTLNATGGEINCNTYNAQDGTTAITVSGADVTCANDLDVTGTLTAGTITLSNITTTGDIECQGHDINAVEGTLNLSKSGSTTTVKGVLNVDEAATFDSTLGVTGAATFTAGVTCNGNVSLGNAKTDTTTLYGDIAADGTQNPDVDLSGSSGNFLTTTGNVTIGPGAVGISGDVTVTAGKDVVTSGAGYFQGVNAQLTNVKANDGTAAITIADTTGAIGLTTATTVSGALACTSTADFQGNVSASTGNPNIDLSASSGTFLTPTGNVTVGGNTTVTGTLDIQGNTTASSGNPSVDLSGSNSTFTTPTGDTTISGDLVITGHIDGLTLLYNTFQCPASGTDWTHEQVGATLATNKAAKKCWIPLTGLNIGDEIVSYKIVGDMHEEGGDTCTLDCKISSVNKADPLTTTDIAGGAIVQVAADGNFDVEATLGAAETVATDKQYVLEILGTTSNVSANEFIKVIGAEVVVNRKA